jgi:Mg2+ and Co2+ transporter CorA
MTNKAYKEHINQLREKEHNELPLTERERADLDAFYQKILDEETKRLAPAFARMQEEKEEMERQIQIMRKLTKRIEECEQRLRGFVEVS